jgi:hypothetical protein
MRLRGIHLAGPVQVEAALEAGAGFAVRYVL